MPICISQKLYVGNDVAGILFYVGEEGPMGSAADPDIGGSTGGGGT